MLRQPYAGESASKAQFARRHPADPRADRSAITIEAPHRPDFQEKARHSRGTAIGDAK